MIGDERRPSEGRYNDSFFNNVSKTIIVMYVCYFGFGCKVYVRRRIKSIASAKMEVANSMEAAKVETNEVVNSH